MTTDQTAQTISEILIAEEILNQILKDDGMDPQNRTYSISSVVDDLIKIIVTTRPK